MGHKGSMLVEMHAEITKEAWLNFQNIRLFNKHSAGEIEQ